MTGDTEAGGTTARVLVVDDSRLMRAAFAKILGDEFDLVYATDGEHGWEALAADPAIEVVITDADMPRLDGYGLIERVRGAADPRLKALPVIMVTGAEDEASRERALAAGTTDFIIKPLDPTQLRARVRAHARLDRTQRELSATAEALRAQGAVDAVTGLCNRRELIERGNQELSFARRHGKPLAIVVFVVDAVERLHAEYGEATATELLKWTADVLRRRMRTEDTVARLGADEFAVLAPATNRLQAVVLCKRLQAALTDPPFAAPDGPMPVTISLALAVPGRERTDAFERHLEWARDQAAGVRAAGGNRLLLAERAAPAPAQAPALDTALDLLARGQGARLEPHLPALLARLLPLLDYADRRFGLATAAALRARLAQDAGPASAAGPDALEEGPDPGVRRAVEEARPHDGEG